MRTPIGRLNQFALSAALALSALSGALRADTPPDLTGIWQSIGYGMVLDVGPEEYVLYETTSKTAVTAARGKVASILDDLGVFSVSSSGDALRVDAPFSLAPIRCERIDSLPNVCTDALDAGDPESLFEVVWHTFNENYAFFELRGIDWSAEYDKWRPRVSAETTDEELLAVLASMMSTLQDNHVVLQAGEFDYSQYRRPPEFPLVRHWREQFDSEKPDAHFMSFLREKYYGYIAQSRQALAGQLTSPPATGANDQLTWGMLPNQVGYLGVMAMAGYAEDEKPQAQFAALSEVIDQAIDDLAEARGMIVDVRFNGGGWDDAALIIASRFADEKRIVLSKKARVGESFTPSHTVTVEPAGPRQFTRPVVLLTSRMTASAAEIFTFCMTAFPHVTQAGLPTMGIHSDMLERHLPNGWQFYLSNEVYQSPQGEVFEKAGILPAQPIPMFRLDDFSDGQDRIVTQALEILRQSGTSAE